MESNFPNEQRHNLNLLSLEDTAIKKKTFAQVKSYQNVVVSSNN